MRLVLFFVLAVTNQTPFGITKVMFLFCFVRGWLCGRQNRRVSAGFRKQIVLVMEWSGNVLYTGRVDCLKRAVCWRSRVG